MPLPNLTQEETDHLAEWRSWLQALVLNRGKSTKDPPGALRELKALIIKQQALAPETEVPFPGWITAIFDDQADD